METHGKTYSIHSSNEIPFIRRVVFNDDVQVRLVDRWISNSENNAEDKAVTENKTDKQAEVKTLLGRFQIQVLSK